MPPRYIRDRVIAPKAGGAERGLGRGQTRSIGMVLAPARQPVRKKVAWLAGVGIRPSRMEDGRFLRSSCDAIFEERAYVEADLLRSLTDPFSASSLASRGGPNAPKLRYLHLFITLARGGQIYWHPLQNANEQFC